MSVNALLKLNKRFSPVSHPFNIENENGTTYGRWEYERGKATTECYLSDYDEYSMFFGKEVLDVGCGEGGKSLYYADCGAKHVTGIELVSEYKAKAEALASSLGLSDKFSFVEGNACALPFPDESFDTVIMSDFFEHVSSPSEALSEAFRVLKPQGRLFINFPPYYHPYGAHLSDAVNIPWVHMLFGEKTLIKAYKTLVADKPDRDKRIELKIRKNENGEYLGYINKMTLKKASRLIKRFGIKPAFHKNIPLRRALAPAAHIPLIREMCVRMSVYVFEKERISDLNGRTENKLQTASELRAGDAVHSGSVPRNDV